MSDPLSQLQDQLRESDEEIQDLCREVEEQRSLISELRRDLSQWAELAGLRGTEVDSLRRERDELRRENDRLRTAKKGNTYIREPFTAEPAEYDEPTWLPAPDSKPEELADAQMVEWQIDPRRGWDKARADRVPWGGPSKIDWRPLYSDSGLPLCSWEGLEAITKYVLTEPDGSAHQWVGKPPPVQRAGYGANKGSVYIGHAPESHSKPGDWRESLMEVMR